MSKLEEQIRATYQVLVELLNHAQNRGLSVHIEPIEDRGPGNQATLHLGGAFIGVSKAL